MQVHVRTPHTKIDIEGEISKKLLKVLKEDYGNNVVLDDDEYLGGYTVTGIGNESGGTVVLDTPIEVADVDKILVIQRVMDLVQDTDYTAYDSFPAEAHERALDRGVMLSQQIDEEVSSSLRIPISEDSALFNMVFPDKENRSSKYMYFGPDGEASVVEAEISLPAVYGISVNGDSVTLLKIDSSDTNYPIIGAYVNGPNNLLQLDSTGKVPISNSHFVASNILGFFRGDDLCPKSGEDAGQCGVTIPVPDDRNPSQRYTDVTYVGGDYFIISMEPGEVSGTMDLFEEIGQVASSSITVTANDGCMYVEELLDDSLNVLVEEGWYFISNIVSAGTATDSSYDDSGNTYITPAANVQEAIGLVDAELVSRDGNLLTKSGSDKSGLDVPLGDLNSISATGFYDSQAGTTNNPEPLGNYNVISTTMTGVGVTQFAIDIDTNDVYTRVFDGAWSTWDKMVNDADMVTYVADTAPDGTWVWDGTTLDITIPI